MCCFGDVERERGFGVTWRVFAEEGFFLYDVVKVWSRCGRGEERKVVVWLYFGRLSWRKGRGFVE